MNNDASKLGRTVEAMKNKGAVQQLLQSEDTKRMMALLEQQGSVQTAAKSAAAGDTSQIMSMMQQLMSTSEGAQLVERITQQAKKSGL